MNIKERIGQRIREARTAKGLTRKALAELTEDLNISRINNYERGDRTPGPTEIKQLANVLEVAPAFLMCLSDDRQGKLNKTPGLGALIPVLDYQQACDPVFHIQEIKKESNADKLHLIPVNPELAARLGANAFALQVKDDSMIPEFRMNDMVIIDPDVLPNPGDFVVAKLEGESEIIIRKYKQLSSSKINQTFDLIAFNEDWANTRISQDMDSRLIGTVINMNRLIKL